MKRLILFTAVLASAAMADPAAEQADAMARMHHGDAPVASPAAQPDFAVAVDSSTVTYGKLGGKPLQGYYTHPKNAPSGLPGVLVFHEWWGLNDNIRRASDRLAAAGYQVLALDLYGGKAADTPDTAVELMQAALGNLAGVDDNIRAAQAWLLQTGHPARTATLGWCFGGGMSFEAAQVLSGKVDATVVYYGSINDRPETLAKLKAPVLGLFGGRDSSIPQSTIKSFEAGLKTLGRNPQIHVYPDAGHAFANPSGKNYRKEDAEDAWKRTLDFLAANLKG